MAARPDSGYCRTCQADGLLDRRGRCSWCGTQVATPPTASRAGANSNRGVPVLMTDAVLERAHELHKGGMSLRKIGMALHAETAYSTPKSLTMALSTQFRHRGWYVRERVAATVKASTVHGQLRRKYRNPAKVREGRLARGEIRGVQCIGTRRNPPQAGRRCQRPALAGSEYCAQHDPARQAALAAQLADMRARVGRP